MKIVDEYIELGETLVRENNVEELSHFFTKLDSEDLKFDILYLFQKLFLKGCLYGNQNTIELFLNIYKFHMSELQQINTRSTIIYGKYLIRKRKDENLENFYNNYYNNIKV